MSADGKAPPSLRTRGFTLIEVLVALVIVALGMLAVIKGVNETVRNADYLRDKTLAHWIAMNRLAEIRLSGRTPEIKKSAGDLEFAGQKWRWRMNVTQTQVQSMRRIDISVRRDGMPENSSLATVTGFVGTAVERPGVVSTTQNWAPAPAGGNPNNPNDPNNPNSPGTPSDTHLYNYPNNPDDADLFVPDPVPPLPENVPPDPPTGPVPAPGED
jgi:general secretion pathway protein I